MAHYFGNFSLQIEMLLQHKRTYKFTKQESANESTKSV